MMRKMAGSLAGSLVGVSGMRAVVSSINAKIIIPPACIGSCGADGCLLLRHGCTTYIDAKRFSYIGSCYYHAGKGP